MAEVVAVIRSTIRSMSGVSGLLSSAGGVEGNATSNGPTFSTVVKGKANSAAASASGGAIAGRLCIQCIHGTCAGSMAAVHARRMTTASGMDPTVFRLRDDGAPNQKPSHELSESRKA